MQTAPSSGIPAGSRKRLSSDAIASMFPDEAAGVALVTPASEALFLRYGPDHPQAGTWAFPGGRLEDGESAEEAARREAKEETGTAPGDELRLLNRNADHGADYSTFTHPIAEQFVPKLSDEHDEYRWAPLASPPQPLHAGVEHLLKAGYMPSGRGDCASDSVLAVDEESVRAFDRDGRLRVQVANISKATVNPYFGKEIPNSEELGLEPTKVYYLLRDPEELRKGAATFNNVQLLRKHVRVSAEDHQADEIVGTTGSDAVFEDPYLKNSLCVWARDAIDDIETEERRELSASYRYKADMTPGMFGGMRYDGVMRDIVANHVALVKDGRAGADVIVGDSNEEIEAMSNRELAKKISAIANRTTTVGSLVAYLRPRLANDAAIDFGKVFDGITGKNFKEKKPLLIQRIQEQSKDRLAKDASIDELAKLVDVVERLESAEGTDEAVTETQHNAMAEAANVDPIAPEPATDAEEGLKSFLKGKGMADDDINTACGMLKPKAATDADPEDKDEKKKKEEEEAAKKAAQDAAAAEADKKGEKEKKEMVDKTAMDAAIDVAVKSTRKAVIEEVRGTERAIRKAEHEVRPFVGELSPSLAFDSADDVYRHALTILGVDGVKDIHASALPTILKMQRKPGARSDDRETVVAMDSSTLERTSKKFGLDRITVV